MSGPLRRVKRVEAAQQGGRQAAGETLAIVPLAATYSLQVHFHTDTLNDDLRHMLGQPIRSRSS
ncbi:hypothetical protein PX52LOC_07582 [Limnoglobus roseus]|uniref:Uncharacterized protein n=1 Tax=Limnoglobus roseus TaxID=2598579 RepID=A0A5C1AMK5_9BACT|nr:hypothetical protein PX52LOC_07582 [Limnoglobus roseus]